jgi:hypothetical protein
VLLAIMALIKIVTDARFVQLPLIVVLELPFVLHAKLAQCHSLEQSNARPALPVPTLLLASQAARHASQASTLLLAQLRASTAQLAHLLQ